MNRVMLAGPKSSRKYKVTWSETSDWLGLRENGQVCFKVIYRNMAAGRLMMPKMCFHGVLINAPGSGGRRH